VVGDVLAAAAAALAEGPGLLVWSGTGSFAIARAANGELHRIGGRGYLLGDQGSGYDLVRAPPRPCCCAIDDLGPATALTAALTKAFGAPAPQRLGAVLQRLDSGEVAQRLPVVLAVAAAGDPVANEVLAGWHRSAGDARGGRGAPRGARLARPAGGVRRRRAARRADARRARWRSVCACSAPSPAARHRRPSCGRAVRRGSRTGSIVSNHNAAGCNVSRSDLFLRDGRVLPKDCFHLSFSRSGGPGGQHANKTETKVDLRLDLAAAEAVLGPVDVARIREALQNRLDADGMLCVTASEHRSQFQNYDAAIERMRNLLASALVRKKRRIGTKPTRGSQRRRARREAPARRHQEGAPGSPAHRE
jgi:ribosome-associated protein